MNYSMPSFEIYSSSTHKLFPPPKRTRAYNINKGTIYAPNKMTPLNGQKEKTTEKVKERRKVKKPPLVVKRKKVSDSPPARMTACKWKGLSSFRF
jgi:hypothetical protein